MNAEQPVVFSTPAQMRLFIAAFAFIGVLIGLLLGGGRAPLAACIGAAIACYFVTVQKFTISESGLTTRVFFRPQTFGFSDSEFRLVKLTGMKSYMTAGHDAARILYANAPGKKEQKLALMLSKKDTEALADILRQKGKLVEA